MTKTHALEARAIAGFVRGLSVRDVEAALTDALGPEAALSKSTVSRVCPEIEGQFQAWQQRRLDEVALDYLFWAVRTSSTTPTPPPSRCSPPGASLPRASPCSSGWTPRRRVQ